MQNVMVVGGAGFIGSNLCDVLLKEGYSVICVDNLMRGTKANIKEALNNDHFVFYQADAADQSQISALMKAHQIDYVFHLAANSDIQASAKDPTVEFDSTLSTTWSLLSAMRENNIRKMFFASTSAVYGEKCDTLLSEDLTLLQPISYYGAAKTASEAFIHAFAHMNNMDVCVFRFANVVGPKLTHGVIYDFVNKLQATPGHLDVLGNGTQTKPYIYVYDLIEAILLLCDRVAGVEIYNVGVETATSVKRIAEIVREEMGLHQAEIRYGTGSIGWKGDVPHFRFDLSRIHATGWHAKLTSDEAVRATVKEVLKCRL